MTLKKIAPFLLLIVLAVVALVLRNNKNSISRETTDARATVQSVKGLNRNPSHINYSKHARCRMDCRKIDESEIKYVLEKGAINYKKSDLQVSDCKKKYAVEAVSKDRQRLRVVFAPCDDEVTVVTCIDLDTEWQCNCD